MTGKGGTGKTTVAAALALALAGGGKRVLLTEVEGRQGLARLFDAPPLPYQELKVAVAPGGGEVRALAIDPKAALLEYLDMFYHLGRAGRMLEKVGAVDFATTVAPGLRDVLLTGKVYEAVRRQEKINGRSKAGGQRHTYDAVVMDGPPTGRIAQFLNVNDEVIGLTRMGPIRNQAAAIMGLLRSPQTAIHLTTVLEEMPVQETTDGVAELTAIGLPIGAIVVNMVREPLLSPGERKRVLTGGIDRSEVMAGLSAAGLRRREAASGNDTTPAALADALLAEGQRHAARVRMEQAERKQLAQLDRPIYELPALAGGVDLGDLYEMAGRLAEQGAA